MTDVSMTVNGTTFVFNDGDVSSVKPTITTAVENNPVTASGPMGGYNNDYDGVSKRIVVKGQLTTATTTRISGYSILSIFQQKQWIESIANGKQTGVIFDSDYEGQSVVNDSSVTPPYQGSFTTTKCFVESMEFDEQAGNPNSLPFVITLIVGVPL